MQTPEVLQFMNCISVVKTSAGSVSVKTPNGVVFLTEPGRRYELATTRAEVEALLAVSNLPMLLKARVITLVF